MHVSGRTSRTACSLGAASPAYNLKSKAGGNSERVLSFVRRRCGGVRRGHGGPNSWPVLDKARPGR